MTLLVTGGTGFVMGHLVRRWLQADGAARVVALDSAPPDERFEAFLAPLRDRVDTVQGSVLDRALLDRLAGRHSISRIVHGAAVTSINRMTETGGSRPDLSAAAPAVEVNVLGTLALLGLASRLPDLRRFVTVGSGAVYADAGPRDRPLPEEGFVDPAGLYDVTKLTAELLTRTAAREFGVPAVSVRFSGVYGPLDRPTASRAVRCVPQRIATAAVAGRRITVNALDAVGDFIHADDVAEALVRMLRGPAPRHPVYNIAQGETVSLRDLLDWTAAALPGTAFAVVPEAEAEVILDPERDSGRWGAYDIARIGEDYGWRPRPARDAYLDYLRWLASTADSP